MRRAAGADDARERQRGGVARDDAQAVAVDDGKALRRAAGRRDVVADGERTQLRRGVAEGELEVAIHRDAAIRGQHQAVVALQMHGVVPRDVLEPETQSLLVEQQRARRRRAVRPELVDQDGLRRRRGEAERTLGTLPREQECGASRRLGSDLRCGQPVQSLVLMRRLPGEVARQHREQRQRREREPSQREHSADGRERNQVAQRETVGPARENADPEPQQGDAHCRGPAPRIGQGEGREDAHAQQSQHDPADGLVSGHGAHQRQRVHEPADQPRGPRHGEGDQPREQPHRAPVAGPAPQAEHRERRGRGAEVERRDLRVRDAEPAHEPAAVSEQQRPDAVGVDVARCRRLAQELEPRQQRDRRKAEGERDRDGRAPSPRVPARATSQSTQVASESAASCCEPLARCSASTTASPAIAEPRRDGLAVAVASASASAGASQAAPPSSPSAADRATRWPEAANAIAANADPGTARVQLPRERVGSERGDQVMERRDGAQRVDRREQPRREQHRRVRDARLRVRQEGLARERARGPVRQMSRSQAVVQEGREGRVERVRRSADEARRPRASAGRARPATATITAATAGASRRAAAGAAWSRPRRVGALVTSRARGCGASCAIAGRLERRRRIADADTAPRVDAVDQRDVLDDRGRLGHGLGIDVVARARPVGAARACPAASAPCRSARARRRNCLTPRGIALRVDRDGHDLHDRRVGQRAA